MAEDAENTLILTLDTGPVTIRLRPDLAPNKLKAEFNAEPHVRGVCSMARSQNPDSADSQFFICFDDARFLDKQYTVWGQVVEGMENVDALPKGEPPRNPGKIVKARAE
ncbi:MAG: peptidylprolyl isomerase [Asticcacaulis sp.]|nr:peptidylprolyl isomerase [Asticcacaulis sp.]